MTAFSGSAALLLLASGCALGREATGPDTWPRSAADGARPQTVYVSKFFEYETGTSITQSGSIETIRETASIKDISGELATAVSEAGVRAVGKVDFDGTGMNKGDLWYRGLLKKESYSSDADVPASILTIGTVFIIGGVLPWPFTVGHGNRYVVRVEVVNSDREIVLTKEDVVQVEYDSIYFWGVDSRRGVPEDRAEMLKRVGTAIAKHAAP